MTSYSWRQSIAYIERDESAEPWDFFDAVRDGREDEHARYELSLRREVVREHEFRVTPENLFVDGVAYAPTDYLPWGNLVGEWVTHFAAIPSEVRKRAAWFTHAWNAAYDRGEY